MPLTYLAGLHGFVFFAPYVAVVLILGHLYRIFAHREDSRRLVHI